MNSGKGSLVDGFDKGIVASDFVPLLRERLVDAVLTSDGYSEEASLFAAIMSSFAYAPFEDDPDVKRTPGRSGETDWLKDQLSQFGLDLVTVIFEGGTDTQGFIACHTDKFVVVAFRGSSSARDWMNNFRFLPNSVVRGRYHGEFHDAIKTTVVTNAFQSAMDGLKGLPVLACGHSLGGALAMIYSIEHLQGKLAGCYTIGAPRIGRVEIETKVSQRIFRVVNDKDVVPRLPFAFIGFRHVGELIVCKPGQGQRPMLDGGHVDGLAAESKDLAGILSENRRGFIEELTQLAEIAPGIIRSLQQSHLDDIREKAGRLRNRIWDAGGIIPDFGRIVDHVTGNSNWKDPGFEDTEENRKSAVLLMKRLLNSSVAEFGLDHMGRSYVAELTKPFQ